jgi:hypothetical protein
MSVYFKIAKAVNIPNYKFDQPIFISAQLTLAAASGANSLSTNAVAPTYSQVKSHFAWKRGDVLTLTTAAGATEQVIVQRAIAHPSLSDTSIVLQGTLSNSYAIGDTVYGYGTGWPHGWEHPSARAGFSYTSLEPTHRGEGSDYSFRCNNLSTSSWAEIKMADTFPTNHWEEYCIYRTGMISRGRFNPEDASMIYIKLSDGRASIPSYKISDEDHYAWTEYDSSVFVSTDDMSSFTDYGYIAIMFYASSSIEAWIDSIYLEHARGLVPTAELSYDTPVVTTTSMFFRIDPVNAAEFTAGSLATIRGWNSARSSILSSTVMIGGIGTGADAGYVQVTGIPTGNTWAAGTRLEEKNNGYYTFTEYPEMTTSWKKVVPITKQRTSGNNLKWANTSGWGDRATKYGLEMRFDNVAYTFYQKMRRCEEWCERGGLLNIHELSENFPELEFDWLQGKLEIHDFRHNIWDRERSSFTLIFEEA